MTTRTCSVDGCDRVHVGRGYCSMHLRRLLRTGDVQADRPARDKRPGALCSIEGCEKPLDGRGWCKMHLTRFYRHGDPECAQEFPDACAVDGCSREFYANGFCGLHYTRARKHGDPLAGTPRYLLPAEAFAARTVRDDATGCLLWTGTLNIGGYGRMRNAGESIAVHRYAWEQAHGPIPEGKYIDHACHNRACAEVAHLRLVTMMQNNWNRSGPASNSTTGVRNVHRKNGRFVVKVVKDGHAHYGGFYDAVGEAAAVAEKMRAELFGTFAGRG